MKERLATVLGDLSRDIVLGTFHSICFNLLQERYSHLNKVYDAKNREVILGILFSDKEEKEIKKLSGELEYYFESHEPTGSGPLVYIVATYRDFVMQHGGIDLADIIGTVVRLWNTDIAWLQACRERYHCVAVDELQDINTLQYTFLKLLAKDKNIFAIGDPDQSIYSFRGSNVQLFFQFGRDFKAKEIQLQTNYRSSRFIVEAATAVIDHNTQRNPSKLIAIRE